MKTLVNILLCVLFSIFATSPKEVSANLSPFSINAEGLDPSAGTAGAADIFQDVADLSTMETNSSDMIAPAWLEILVLISPANFPISTFLTQKVLDGIRGLAKAESLSGKHPDIFVQTDSGASRFNPKYRTSTDTMSNYKQFGESEVSNYKLNWGEIAVLPFQDTLTALFAGGATSATLSVTNPLMWTPHCLAKVQGGAYGTSGAELVLFVEAMDKSASTIDVISIGQDGAEDIPAIASAARLTRMGTAFAEGSVKNDSVSQSPTSDFNYAQKFITSIVYSNWLMMTSLFTNYSFSMVTNLALQDFRYGQEFSFMFGVRSSFGATVNGVAETIRTTGGLTHYIDQVIEYGTGSGDTTIAEADIVDFTKDMRVGNNGSDTRYLFAGSGFIGSLNKGVMNDKTRFVQKDYDTVYGLSFTVLYSFFGTINVTYAPLMDQSDFIDRGFLLDMQYVDKFVFQPFRETRVDLEKLRDYDGKSVDMLETCGLVVRNTDTHFIFEVKA